MIINAEERPHSPAPSELLPDYSSTITPTTPSWGESSVSLSSATSPLNYTSPPARPSQPLTYTFADWTHASVHLLPPPTAADLAPLYHIATELSVHPLAPLSYVTTIRRGSERGPLVGSFEMAVHHRRRAFVTLGDSTTRLNNVLFGIKGSKVNWGWRVGDVKLRWDCHTLDDGSPLCICYDLNPLPLPSPSPPHSHSHAPAQPRQIASFVPPPVDGSPPLPPATLTVFPDGHVGSLFDHIVVSALVVERRREVGSGSGG